MISTETYIEKATKCFCKVCEHKLSICKKGFRCVALVEFQEAFKKEIRQKKSVNENLI